MKVKKLFRIVNVIIYDMTKEDSFDIMDRANGILNLIKKYPYFSSSSKCNELLIMIKSLMLDMNNKKYSEKNELGKFCEVWSMFSGLIIRPTPLIKIGTHYANYLYYHCDLRCPQESIIGYCFDKKMIILNTIAYDIGYNWSKKVYDRISNMISYIDHYFKDSPRKEKMLSSLKIANEKFDGYYDGRSVRNEWENASNMAIEPIKSYKLTNEEISFLVHNCDLVALDASIIGYKRTDDS